MDVTSHSRRKAGMERTAHRWAVGADGGGTGVLMAAPLSVLLTS
jgi:hypothetical protein